MSSESTEPVVPEPTGDTPLDSPDSGPLDLTPTAQDLRHLHQEINRLRAGLVDVNARMRTLLSPGDTAYRRTIADTDSQQLTGAIHEAVGIDQPPVSLLLQRLLWFELATGSHVPCGATSFVIWAVLAVHDGTNDQHTYIHGPSADLVAEAIAEATFALGRPCSFSFRAADRSNGERLGRRSLDAEPKLRQVAEFEPDAPVDTAIVHGADAIERLDSLLAWEKPPAMIAVTSLEILRDPSLAGRIAQRHRHHRLAMTWEENVILVPPAT